VLGQAEDRVQPVDLVRRDTPDVVITDLRMPPRFADEGIELAAEIRAIAPHVGLLVLSQYVEVHHALRLIDEFETSVGYLLKDRVSDLTAFSLDVRRIAAGEVVIDPELVTLLVRRRRERDPLAELTERERTVLALMAQGLTNAALSKELFVSPKTIEGYVRSIFSKFDLAPSERDHRRVLAVLEFLRQQ
jgi:DNA-binding NarL/FixJ family response regulator